MSLDLIYLIKNTLSVNKRLGLDFSRLLLRRELLEYLGEYQREEIRRKF